MNVELVEVDHKALLDAARAIEEYCDLHDQQMGRADTAVKAILGREWIGADALEFSRKWEEVDSKDSTSTRFRKNMEGYAKALRSCAKLYRDAQIEVYNRSRNLLLG